MTREHDRGRRLLPVVDQQMPHVTKGHDSLHRRIGAVDREGSAVRLQPLTQLRDQAQKSRPNEPASRSIESDVSRPFPDDLQQGQPECVNLRGVEIALQREAEGIHDSNLKQRHGSRPKVVEAEGFFTGAGGAA
jgi:hypothetical protein